MNTKNTSAKASASAKNAVATKNTKPQREELSSSQKQQRFAKVVALVLAGALVLSVAAPALSTLFM